LNAAHDFSAMMKSFSMLLTLLCGCAALVAWLSPYIRWQDGHNGLIVSCGRDPFEAASADV
jgi:hypothetical protein